MCFDIIFFDNSPFIGGDLSEYIKRQKKEHGYFQERQVMSIFVQLCRALKHVHGLNILHRDLKAQNGKLTMSILTLTFETKIYFFIFVYVIISFRNSISSDMSARYDQTRGG